MIESFANVLAVRTLLDRARLSLTHADLPKLVMGDPGTPGYIAAYKRVLDGGADELLRDGGALLRSFDITENLGISHADVRRSARDCCSPS